MKKQTRFFLTILCMVFLCVFAFSGYKLYSIIHEYRLDQQKYNGLSGEFVTQTDKEKDPAQTASPEEEGPREVSPRGEATLSRLCQLWEFTARKKPRRVLVSSP